MLSLPACNKCVKMDEFDPWKAKKDLNESIGEDGTRFIPWRARITDIQEVSHLTTPRAKVSPTFF